MKRRQYIKASGAAVTGSALGGCTAGDPSLATGPDDTADEGTGTEETSEGGRSDEPTTGTLATSVTDRPVDIDDFESCVITIDGIWVKPDEGGSDDGSEDDVEESSAGSTSPTDDGGTSEAGEGAGDLGTENAEETDETEGIEESEGTEETGTPGETERSEGRRYIEFDGPQEADLVRLQGANTQLIGETELAVGSYRYLQIEVSGVKGVLREGGEAEVDTPGNAPLQFKERFEIRSNERTRFVADFAPVRRGQGDRYLLRPVATGTRVLYSNAVYDPDAEGGNGEDADADEDADGEADDADEN